MREAYPGLRTGSYAGRGSCWLLLETFDGGDVVQSFGLGEGTTD